MQSTKLRLNAGLNSVLVLAMFAVSACALPQVGGYQPVVGDVVGPRAEFEGTPINRTASGDYLAGHLAQGSGDWASAAVFMNDALSRDANNEQLLRRAFLLNLGAGSFDTALIQARQVVEQPKPLDLALVLLLADASRSGDLDLVESNLRMISDDGLQTVLKPGFETWLLAARGETEAALEKLESFGQFGGFEALIALHSAFIYEFSGDLAAARAAYLDAVEVSPTLRAGQAYGAFLARQGEVPAAIEVYSRYFARDGSALLASGIRRLSDGGAAPKGIDTINEGIAAILFDFTSILQGDLGLELSLVLTQIANYANQDFPLAELLLADLLAERDQFDAAEAAYTSIDEDNDIALAATIRLSRMYDDADRQAEALDIIRRAARQYPNEYALQSRLGDLYRRDEQYRQAISAYDRAIELLPRIEPDHWTIFYTRGIAYERSNQWPRAEADLKKALELQPDQPFVLNYLGYTWADQGQRLAEAEAMIRKAVTLRPNDGFIVDSLGWVLYRLGRFDEAVGLLERAVALSPNDQTINDHLGDALWRVGRRIEARFQWQRAIDIGTDSAVTADAENKLRNGLPAIVPVDAAADAVTTDITDAAHSIATDG